jgi:hypothetical protein
VEVDSGSKISRENSFADVWEAAQEVASDPVMTTNDGIESSISPESSLQGDSESVLNKLAEPCRTIVLPLQWTRLKSFWPRRYKAEFRIMRDRSGNSLNLTRMVPEAPASPALDARIFKSFSECVQEQTDKLNIAVLRYSGALTPEPGEAYSVLMEFSPGDTRVASQQGI